MWLSGQHKRPAESGEGQTGIVTMSGEETAVLLDSERRGVQVYAPAGYRWAPMVGQQVLVIQGKGEIPCVVGARQDLVPDRVTIQAGRMAIQGGTVEMKAGDEAVIQAGKLELTADVSVKGEALEEMIARIVRAILAGGGAG